MKFFCGVRGRSEKFLEWPFVGMFQAVVDWIKAENNRKRRIDLFIG